jgi:hypothetical protein
VPDEQYVCSWPRLRNFSHLPKSVWSLGECRLATTSGPDRFEVWIERSRGSVGLKLWALDVCAGGAACFVSLSVE